MLATVLVPLDDSSVSRDALPYAMALGSAARARVLLF
jgi:hypothetical protein